MCRLHAYHTHIDIYIYIFILIYCTYMYYICTYDIHMLYIYTFIYIWYTTILYMYILYNHIVYIYYVHIISVCIEMFMEDDKDALFDQWMGEPSWSKRCLKNTLENHPCVLEKSFKTKTRAPKRLWNMIFWWWQLTYLFYVHPENYLGKMKPFWPIFIKRVGSTTN